MGFKKELLPFFLMIILIMPYGYYFAGKQVYDTVAHTNTDCWGNFDQNTPEQFAPLRNEVPLNESTNSENITSNIMEGLSEYWWPGYENATIEVEDEDLFLSAWYLRQNDSMPWVIFVHGIRGCKSGGELMISSGMLANAGFNVISFDLRDHGESSIDDNRVSGGQDEWKDVVAVFDWLIDEQDAKPDQIGLFGTSMGAGTVAIAFSLDDRMQSVWLDSGYSDMGKIVVEELEFQGLPTFLGPAGIFAGKISAGQNLVEYYPLEAASEIGDRHMYVVHGNQDKRVRLHHGEEMCEIALENGKEGNVECWFEDSVIRYDVGKGMDSDEHVSLMLTHTEDYDNRLVEFFTRSLM
ncbi:alpha/beta fold hydrolase [Candidatus Poseidoniaceae archaeon]|jgi:dipeptidyl aminopeptidase/acylaminoacyl peptidase|nr:alpha/beta fold hydrolase [Candidatus Poseidoniaceae archaeon]